MTVMTEKGLLRILKSKKRETFCMNDGNRAINELTGGRLPAPGECYKFISLTGGFASVHFIKVVAENEPIEELTASTLRVGEKQFTYLSKLCDRGRLQKATFFVGSIMKEDTNKELDKYDYFTKFAEVSERHGWESVVTNNHSKVILMRTAKNHYVLESSSNLNENPKIEQYSFENCAELYEFYHKFFNALKTVNSKNRN